jgi:hypothetical protein
MDNVRRTLTSLLIVLLLLLPVASADRWQVIKSFIGSGTEGYDTDAFNVSGSEWRIDWNFMPNPQASSYLTVLAFPQGETGNSIAEVYGSSANETTSGTSYVHQAGGNYYLHIDAVNTLSYNVTVLYDTNSASSGFDTESAVIVLIAMVVIVALIAVVLRHRRK